MRLGVLESHTALLSLFISLSLSVAGGCGNKVAGRATGQDPVTPPPTDTSSPPTANQPPTAAITAPLDGSYARPTDSLTLVGVDSDPDGTVVSRSWAITPAGVASAEQTFVTTLPLGDQSIVYTVRDNGGAESSAAALVHVVVSLPPAVSIASPLAQSYDLGTSISFSGSAVDPEGGAIAPASYHWTISSSALPSVNGQLAFSAALELGAHVVTLSVDDPGGGPAGTAQVAFTVVPVPVPPPAVTITSPVNGRYELTGSAPNLRGTISDASAIVAANVLWTITAPDATVTQAPGTVAPLSPTAVDLVYTYTFALPGDYTIVLSYSNGTASAQQSITVHSTTNLPPAVTIRRFAGVAADANGDGIVDIRPVEGSTVAMSGRVQEPDTDPVVSASILWTVTAPGGATTTSAGAITCALPTRCDSVYSHAFGAPGSYLLELEATDGLGRRIVASLTVIVRPNTPPTCRITAPGAGASAPPAALAVSAAVYDPDQPAATLSVAWYLDAVSGAPLATGANASVDLTAFANCTAKTLICVATDSFAATGQGSVALLVNTPPTVSITSIVDDAATPNDARASAGAFVDPAAVGTVSIASAQNDLDGNVTLEVYDSLTGAAVSAAVPGLANPSTHTTLWSMAPAPSNGRHTLVAKVTDNCGASATAQDDVIVGTSLVSTGTMPAAELNGDVHAILPLGAGALYVGYFDAAAGQEELTLFAGVGTGAVPTLGTATLYGVLLNTLIAGRSPVNAILAVGTSIYFGTDDGLIACPMTNASGGDYSLAVANLANPVECNLVRDYTNAVGQPVASPRTLALVALPAGALVAATDAGVVWLASPATSASGVACLDGVVRVFDAAYEAIGNAVYLGTDGLYAYRWASPFTDCSLAPLDNLTAPFLAGGVDSIVEAVAVDASGGVWFGTDEPSLLRFDAVSDTWVAYRSATPSAGANVFVNGTPVFDIAIESRVLGSPAASRDIAWSGFDARANVEPSLVRADLTLPSWTGIRRTPDGLANLRVARIAIGAGGIKWLATPSGVGFYAWP